MHNVFTYMYSYTYSILGCDKYMENMFIEKKQIFLTPSLCVRHDMTEIIICHGAKIARLLVSDIGKDDLNRNRNMNDTVNLGMTDCCK